MMITAKTYRTASRRSIASIADSRNQNAESAAGLKIFMADEGSSIPTAKTMIFRQPTKEKRGPGFRKSSRPVRAVLPKEWPGTYFVSAFAWRFRVSILHADAADLRRFGHQSPSLHRVPSSSLNRPSVDRRAE